MAHSKKILNDGLTNKQRILRMVERWDDDIPFDKALYHMYALKKIMDGIKSAEEEEWIDHDELFDELERLCDEEEAQAEMVAAGKGRLETPSKVDRGRGRAKNGKVIRKPTKKVRGSVA
jgi:hypothetical protein